jgi:ADP-heptose:LPS heptosyltransferase
MTPEPIPADPKRLLLVNPTKYLGNLLLAGGLIQAFAAHCRSRDIDLKLILDDSLRELCENSFPAGSVIWFPRRAINRANPFSKFILYRRCVKAMRAFDADLAFNIEEDAATSHLTRLSGARFKLGCSQARHRRGYDHVVPVRFEGREAGREHRWFSYLDMFTVLGMPAPETPAYLALDLAGADAALKQKLEHAGVDFSRPLVAIHGGATKAYKQWPAEHYADLCRLVTGAGMQPVLIGAGDSDHAINRRIEAALGDDREAVNLCNALSLKELGQFLPLCHYMAGNDSGPSHLASALGVDGSVIFGPTNMAIWKPLGPNTHVLQNSQACDPACSKGHCLKDYRCLRDITAATVFGHISLPC